MSQLKRYAPSLLLCFFCKSTRNLSFRYPTKDRENEGIYIIYCPELLIRTTHIHKPIHYLIHTIHKLVTNGIKVIPAINGRNSWTIQFVCLGFNDMKIFLFVFFFFGKEDENILVHERNYLRQLDHFTLPQNREVRVLSF